MFDNWTFGRVRKWFAGLTTTAMVVLAVAAFFGFFGLVGGSPFMFVIGAGIAGGWWYFEYRYNQPSDPTA
jgi:hypothetical protein